MVQRNSATKIVPHHVVNRRESEKDLDKHKGRNVMSFLICDWLVDELQKLNSGSTILEIINSSRRIQANSGFVNQSTSAQLRFQWPEEYRDHRTSYTSDDGSDTSL
mmetsp:Transcript_7293/g.25087  ORF Transcript_7293/g.25087 Transcript_7293/m.25087 type:complete len:106 (+) Transcript_7293:2908-3225(+)